MVRSTLHDEWPSVWITVVTYNSRKWIVGCLESIEANPWPVTIIVVDNNSTDGTPELIAERYPHVRLVREKLNQGFSVACNRGMEYALDEGAHLILHMNDDARLFPDTLETLVRLACVHADFGVLIPANLRYDGDENDPVFAAELRRNGVRSGDMCRDVVPVERLPGAVLLTRAEVLRDWGGLDPLFYVDGAEYDYCLRIQHGGWKVGFTPSVKVRHEYYRHYSDYHRLPLEKHISEFRATGICTLKNPSFPISFCVLQLGLVSSYRLLVSLVTLNPGRGLGTVIGLVKLACDFPRIARRRKLSLSRSAPFLHLKQPRTVP